MDTRGGYRIQWNVRLTRSALGLHSARRMTVDLVAFNPLTRRIIGAAIEVHRQLGPGLLESIYQECLARELALRQLSFITQQSAPVVYKGVRLAAVYRLDLIVEGVVVVEIKSVTALNAVHHAQTLTYMRIAACPIGLLINFNVPRLIDGITRLVNGAAGGDRGVEEHELDSVERRIGAATQR
jgi:GxxExxY protein